MGKNVVFRFSALGSCLLFLAIGIITSGCSSAKLVGDDDYWLSGVGMISDKAEVKTSQLYPYIRQKADQRRFLIFKKKEVFDTIQARLTREDLTRALNNMGYMNAGVEVMPQYKDKKVKVLYVLHPGEPYVLGNVEYDIRDSRIAEILQMDKEENRRLRSGQQFSVEALNNERQRITKILTDDGYYRFHKDFIRFTADTVRGGRKVDLTLLLNGDNHARYMVRGVNFQPDENGKYHLRRHVLEENSWIEEGKYYSGSALQRTYNKFGRLPIVRYTNIKFVELPDTNLLDCNIQISTNKPNSIIFQPEGTNTAGDLGAAASLTWENRNLFRGSETFSIKLRGAYEAIKDLEGYQNSNYQEYSIEAKLQFPRMIAPLLSREFRRNSTATSELSVAYDMQDRPEFHRRVFSAAWKYRWQDPQHHTRWRLDVVDLNYIYMPWISSTFRRDYLENSTSRNAILRYNYEDLFIMKAGFGFSYSHRRNSWRVNVETSGNLLNALSKPLVLEKNSNDQYTLFNIAYAQYAKADVDYTHIVPLDSRNQLVLHGDFGIAYPYGNSTVLPFEKRYFSGGANSVRGWHVRGLGPGGFKGTDGRIDFINQTGDVKLDLNMELRTPLFWKFAGALFVDAGNIWTLREYEEQPGGQFKWKNILKQMAAAYGLGIRLNFDYFVVRFDMGMKAVNPAYETRREHYPIAYPKLSRDFAFHFAVGMPF
ncbi:MAG: BamA/TamA family outer membrane protein [Prevotella sp.]|nr:BamA/TamA family outer membrane protein [Prevotella sp.]